MVVRLSPLRSLRVLRLIVKDVYDGKCASPDERNAERLSCIRSLVDALPELHFMSLSWEDAGWEEAPYRAVNLTTIRGSIAHVERRFCKDIIPNLLGRLPIQALHSLSESEQTVMSSSFSVH